LKNPTAHILGLCKQRGFVAAGIAPAQPSQWSKQMLAWLEAGKHGAMEYLSNDLELRFNPSHVFPGTKSFLVVADQYAPRVRTKMPPKAASRVTPKAAIITR